MKDVHGNIFEDLASRNSVEAEDYKALAEARAADIAHLKATAEIQQRAVDRLTFNLNYARHAAEVARVEADALRKLIRDAAEDCEKVGLSDE